MKSLIICQIHTIIKSNAYLERLKTIHEHYRNVKSELRYRDALLEEFNKSEFNGKEGLRAYAEVNSIDLTIIGIIKNIDIRVNIQIKYQFPFDMVAAPIKNFIADFDARVDIERKTLKKKGGVADLIVADCLDTQCDLFILIIHDFTGYSLNRPLPQDLEKAFHREQARLDRRPAYYGDWRTSTENLLNRALAKRSGELKLIGDSIKLDVTPPDSEKLFSYIYMIDFILP